MTKTIESAFGRSPSFHHLLRIIVMMLLCLICATPQMSAKTITINFVFSDLIKDEYLNKYVVTKENISVIFSNDDLSVTLCKDTQDKGIEVLKGKMQVKAESNIQQIKLIYSSSKPINTAGSNKEEIISGVFHSFATVGTAKGFEIQATTILQSVTVVTSEPEPIMYKLTTVSEPSDGGTISILDTDENEVTELEAIAAGTTLKVNPIPAPDYEVDKILVDGKELISPYRFTVDADTEITATFKKITYPVTLSEYQNGKVVVTDGNGTEIKNLSAIESGSKLTVTLTPEDGYAASLTSNVEGSVKETTTGDSNGVRTYDVTVTKDTNLTATFTKKKYAVKIAVPENGTLTVTTSSGATINDNNEVEHGTELTITPNPTSGYKTASVSVNGTEPAKTQDKYIHLVTGPTNIEAIFEADNENFATLSIPKPQNGTITVTSSEAQKSYENNDRVPINTKLTVTAKPAEGNKLTGISAGQASQEFNTTGEGTLECTATAGTFIISATFAEYKTYSVTWTVPNAAEGTMTVKNGDVTINSGTEIESSTTISVTLEAKEGYTPSLKVNNATVEPTSTENDGRTQTYSVKVTAPTTLTPEFTKDSYTVTIVGSDNGSVSVKAGETVIDNGSSIDYGTKLTITPTPASGYKTASLLINKVSVLLNNDGSYEMTVKEDVSIEATFTEDKPIVQTVAVTWSNTNPDGGEMTVKSGTASINSGSKVDSGTVLTVTLTPADGYAASLSSDVEGSVKETTTGDNNGVRTYEVTVTKDTNLTATFTKKKYAVKIAVPENGTLTVTTSSGATINDNDEVGHGTELTITSNPTSGYKTAYVSVNGTELTRTQDKYTHLVTGPTNIAATFVADNENFATLSITKPQNGTITVTSSEPQKSYENGKHIPVNTALVVKAKPNTGYKLTAIKAGEKSQEFNTTGEGTLECTATAGTFNIAATFAKYEAYAVTWTVPNAAEGTMTVKNGDATINSGTEIENGTTLTVTLEAKEGYTPSLKVSDTTLEPTSTENDGRTKTYDITINKATTLTPQFTKNKYAVAILKAENGSVTVATSSGAAISDNNEVGHGTELIITPTPDTGYKTVSVTVNAKPLTPNQGRYTYAITEAVTITARFEVDNENYATLSISKPENGTLTVTSSVANEPHKSGDLVKVGTKLTIKAKPADGYRLKGITAGSVTYPLDDTTEKTVEPDVTKGSYIVSAQIEKIKLHAVSWTNANPDGGTITVTHGTETVTSGTGIETGKEINVTLTAKEGYTPLLESDVSGSLTETATGSGGLLKIYKVTITGPTTLTAKFIKKQPDKATIQYTPADGGSVAFFSDAALTKPIDTTDGLKIEIGTTVYIQARPSDSNYEAKVVYSTDGATARTLTPDSNGIFQFVAADAKATLSVSFVIKICDVTSRITCTDGDAAKAGTIEWKLSDSKTYDSPAKVESGKTINVRIKAAEGYRITAASGADITDGAKVTDVEFDLSISNATEITATLQAIPRGTINLDTAISGLPEDIHEKVKVTVATSDGTPVAATDKVEEGTKLRIVASTEDNRYRFTAMSIGEHKATINTNGSTAVIDGYIVASPAARQSGSSFELSLDIVMSRRTIAVTYTSQAANATVTVTSTDVNGNLKTMTSGASVPVDTELHFKATPDTGYKIESMTVTPTAGTALASTSANTDADGVCTLTTRTPVSLDNDPSTSYRIEVTCRNKNDGQIYKMHYVTLAIADGQADYGSVRFVDPKSEGMTVATERKVTFEATPTDMPADGRLGRYSFAGWNSSVEVPATERATAEAARSNAVYSYGGDADATFTATFTKNCLLTFEETHTGGTLTITGPDGALIESGDFVAPGTEITVSVAATPSTGYRVNLIIINGAAAYIFEDYPEAVTQTVTVEADMTLGCDIFIPSGIDEIDVSTGKDTSTWFTLDGTRLGTERPSQTGIYIVVDRTGRARKVIVRAD